MSNELKNSSNETPRVAPTPSPSFVVMQQHLQRPSSRSATSVTPSVKLSPRLRTRPPSGDGSLGTTDHTTTTATTCSVQSCLSDTTTVECSPYSSTSSSKAIKSGPNKGMKEIQEWHAVLGDNHCAWRSTRATKILKEVKQEFKEKHVGKHRSGWYAEAIHEYFSRAEHEFAHVPEEDRGRVLIQCTPQVIKTQRVVHPYTYGYEGKQAIYGSAKMPEAVHFFFNSRDAPVLEKEVARFRTRWKELGDNLNEKPPQVMMNEFDKLLQFVESKLQAPEDNEMAKETLKSIKFIPVIQRHWKMLVQSLEPVIPYQVSPGSASFSGDLGKQDVTGHASTTAKTTEANEDSPPGFDTIAEFSTQSCVKIKESDPEETSVQDYINLLLSDPLFGENHVDDEDPVANEFLPETQAVEPGQRAGNEEHNSQMDSESERINRELRQEVSALKSQIDHLNGMVKLLLKGSPTNEHLFRVGAEALPGDRFIKAHLDDQSTTSSHASGRKRGRRTSRRSSSTRRSRSLSLASKRSRSGARDDDTVASVQIPFEIEMHCDSEDLKDNDDIDSYESYDSGELHRESGLSKASRPSSPTRVDMKANQVTLRSAARGMNRSSNLWLPPEDIACGKNRPEAPGEAPNSNKVKHVTDLEIRGIGRNDGGVYSGMISICTGMPHGSGRYDFTGIGRAWWYDGEWRHGKRHGFGRLDNGQGDLYEGGFKNGKKNGQGAMNCDDGRKLNGIFVEDQLVYGSVLYPDGSTYRGQWLNGMPHGNGKKKFADGTRYEGEFRDGFMSSLGMLFKEDGSMVESGGLNGEPAPTDTHTSPYAIFRYDGFFEDGLDKKTGRLFRRVRNRAAEQSSMFGSRRKRSVGELPPLGFKGGSMSGLSKQVTDDGFLYGIFDEGDSSDSEESVSGEENDTAAAVASVPAAGRRSMLSRIMGGKKSMRQGFCFSRGTK